MDSISKSYDRKAEYIDSRYVSIILLPPIRQLHQTRNMQNIVTYLACLYALCHRLSTSTDSFQEENFNTTLPKT
jgi:hypothetical protein